MLIWQFPLFPTTGELEKKNNNNEGYGIAQHSGAAQEWFMLYICLL